MVDNGVRHLVVTDGDHAVAVMSMRDVVAALLAAGAPDAALALLCSLVPTELWLG